MPGGDIGTVQRIRPLQQRPPFDMCIAKHTGIWRPPRQVFIHKVVDDKVPELLPDIQYKMRESMLDCRHPRVIKTVQVAAPCFLLRRPRARIVPCLHGDPYDFIPLIVEHQRRNGTVDTAAHRYQDLSFPAHV